MALEKTALSKENMERLLLSEYGLHLIEETRLSQGTANCFRIHCREGEFFLKEYQSWFTPEDVDAEGKLVSFLIARGFPTAAFVKTASGKYHTEFGGHRVGVQEFIDKRTDPFVEGGSKERKNMKSKEEKI